MSDEVNILEPPRFSVSITFFGETQNTATRSIWHCESGYETFGTPVAKCLESAFSDFSVFDPAVRVVAAATVWNLGFGEREVFDDPSQPDPRWHPAYVEEHNAWSKLLQAAKEYCMLIRARNTDGSKNDNAPN